MKKNVLLSGVLFFVVTMFSVSAQEEVDTMDYSTGMMTYKFSEGWFLGVSVGGQIYWGGEGNLAPLKDRLKPIFSVSAGKWILPYIGLRLSYDGLSTSIFSKNMIANSLATVRKDGLYENKYGYNNFHVDFMYNVSEHACRENLKRVYSFIPYAGIGLFQLYKKGLSANPFTSGNNEFSLNLGIINRFRITENLSLNAEVQAIILRGGIATPSKGGILNIADAITPIKVGVVYRFGKTPSKRAVGVAYVEMLQSVLAKVSSEKENMAAILPLKEKEIKDKQDQIAALQQEIEKSIKEITANELKVQPSRAKFVVFFGSDSYSLDAKDKVALRYAADVIKNSPDQRYFISAYADAQTGDERLNKELTVLRAEAVYKFLIDKYDVNPDQLIKKANGQENLPHDSYQLNRVVVVEPDLENQ